MPVDPGIRPEPGRRHGRSSPPRPLASEPPPGGPGPAGSSSRRRRPSPPANPRAPLDPPRIRSRASPAGDLSREILAVNLRDPTDQDRQPARTGEEVEHRDGIHRQRHRQRRARLVGDSLGPLPEGCARSISRSEHVSLDFAPKTPPAPSGRPPSLEGPSRSRLRPRAPTSGSPRVVSTREPPPSSSTSRRTIGAAAIGTTSSGSGSGRPIRHGPPAKHLSRSIGFEQIHLVEGHHDRLARLLEADQGPSSGIAVRSSERTNRTRSARRAVVGRQNGVGMSPPTSCRDPEVSSSRIRVSSRNSSAHLSPRERGRG